MRFSLLLLLALAALSHSLARAQTHLDYKLLTTRSGLHRVTFEALAKAGLKADKPTDRMGLFNQGQAVPIHLKDGGDGHFGPGDWFEFRAETLKGELSHIHEYSPYNAYMLALDVDHPARMTTRFPAITLAHHGKNAAPKPGPAVFTATQHLEVDTLLMRFQTRDYAPHEVWFWHKLSCTDAKPFEQSFHLDDLNKDAADPIKLAVDLRGWSIIAENPRGLPDHQIQVYLNDQLVATHAWSGKDTYRLEDELPRHLLKPGVNRIGLRTPRREDEGRLVIDVAILNWLELSWPQTGRLKPSQQTHLDLTQQATSQTRLAVETRTVNITLYSDQGARIPFHKLRPFDSRPLYRVTFPALQSERSFLAVPDGGQLQVDEIVPLRPNHLLQQTNQADYLIITHPALSDAVEPLAQFHRRNGLKVVKVDVRDLYDHFNHGILHPSAIKKFISHAYHQWQAPKPRFVLLVGDASWDTKHHHVRDENYPDLTFYPRFLTEFNKIESTAYQDADVNNRNLIPTWNFFDATGHSASDNWFVCVNGDNYYPDLAIGRFPVTTPEEVTAIVAKTIRYMEAAEVGPWRRRLLMITNESPEYQQLTDGLAGDLAESGFAPEKIYPASAEKSNAAHTPHIIQALDRGQYLVYFYGHGGRYIWRTGPPDHRKNHDLFTLDDLDNLKPSTRNPVVLSFTCFSAPFDHPGADSIGEKFLRLPERGAVAFVGASWRNAPNISMNRRFMEAFCEGGTVGEALNRGKTRLASRTLVETYNLMGDPAVPLQAPPKVVDLTFDAATAAFDGVIRQWAQFAGNAVIDWLDESGNVLRSESFQVTKGRFHYKAAQAPPEGAVAANCYVWNQATRQDGVGGLRLTQPARSDQSL